MFINCRVGRYVFPEIQYDRLSNTVQRVIRAFVADEMKNMYPRASFRAAISPSNSLFFWPGLAPLKRSKSIHYILSLKQCDILETGVIRRKKFMECLGSIALENTLFDTNKSNNKWQPRLVYCTNGRVHGFGWIWWFQMSRTMKSYCEPWKIW